MSAESFKLDRITLFQEYRLIERSENEVNGAWRGAHLLLFFLAFVFGSFCTFCFHMLMYLFEEKCVLFPKLLSLTGIRHSILYDFIPNKEEADALPVDFVTTQWVEKSTCYLPTYVPLLSGIFGLVWTTMFLMCSSGSQTLTGLQRSWRILPPIFVFSIAMSSLCVYSSMVTHMGLLELCVKLGEITGSPTCSYTINVATLAYERRIRGVYQAVRLTILTAWLHTICWILEALLTVIRVILVVDFRLVRIRAELQGDIDKMLERHETHIRTVSPELWILDDTTNTRNIDLKASSSIKIHFKNETYDTQAALVDIPHISITSAPSGAFSLMSLVPDEENKLQRMAAAKNVAKQHRFIVRIVYDLLDSITIPEEVEVLSPTLSASDRFDISTSTLLPRKHGHELISSMHIYVPNNQISRFSECDMIVTPIITQLLANVFDQITFSYSDTTSVSVANVTSESTLNNTTEIIDILEKNRIKQKYKSNLKNKRIQTDLLKSKKTGLPKVQIRESNIKNVSSGSDITLKAEDDESHETLTMPSHSREIQEKDSKDKETQAKVVDTRETQDVETQNEEKHYDSKDTQTQQKEKQD